uniref:SAM domain-containing protein n=1 Tax=Megaselia scalaris TaxID=36166 RepID=T1GA01_MEGSC
MKEIPEPVNTAAANNTKIYQTKNRPRPVYLWSANEVKNWYQRHCGEYEQYIEYFMKNDIVGKVLLRITDKSLQRMGITDNQHREHIWREIVKLKLKTDIMEIKDLERISIEIKK